MLIDKTYKERFRALKTGDRHPSKQQDMFDVAREYLTNLAHFTNPPDKLPSKTPNASQSRCQKAERPISKPRDY